MNFEHSCIIVCVCLYALVSTWTFSTSGRHSCVSRRMCTRRIEKDNRKSAKALKIVWVKYSYFNARLVFLSAIGYETLNDFTIGAHAISLACDLFTWFIDTWGPVNQFERKNAWMQDCWPSCSSPHIIECVVKWRRNANTNRRHSVRAFRSWRLFMCDTRIAYAINMEL